jgi:hypothetical protein
MQTKRLKDLKDRRRQLLNSLRSALKRILRTPIWRYDVQVVACLLLGLLLGFTRLAPLVVIVSAIAIPIIWYIRLYREQHEYILPFIYRLLLNLIVMVFYIGLDASKSGFYFIDLVGTFLTVGIFGVAVPVLRFIGYPWKELLKPHLLYLVFVAPVLPYLITSAILRTFGYPF